MIVYGRPGCSACEIKKQELDKAETKYVYMDVDKLSQEELVELVKQNGGKTALPIIVGEE